MTHEKDTFNVLDSIKNHIEILKPVLPKQALVCTGEYSIKAMLRRPFVNKIGQPASILIGSSSDEIYKWLPNSWKANLVLGLEDAKIDTHFWYDVLAFLSKDETLIETLKKQPFEKLQGAIIVTSVWDGIGSALLPTLISKFKP